MAAHAEHLELAGEFPGSSRAEWRDLVSAVLARSGFDPDADGADPEAELTSQTYDGIAIKPLYTAADAPDVSAAARPLAITGEGTGWDVRQRHADPDPVRTNKAVLDDLNNGATSLWLQVGEAGLAVDDLEVALQGVYLDLAPIAVDAGAQTREAAATLLGLAASRAVAPADLAGTLGADPIGLRARTGADADLSVLADLAPSVADHPNLRVATVDATVYHGAGGGDSDELAVAASVGVAYLRALAGSGLTVDAALDAIEFRYAVTADQFLSVAKLRAARRIWGRIAELSGVSAGARGQRQHAVTSAAMMTRRDPWVNLLRTTIACFAAAIGGADSISVAPFDAAIGLPDDFARRIARNTASILHDESSLGRVLDAAGGSWYVESLTSELASVAWQKFTAIERAGGALAALDSGAIAELVGTSQAARAEDIAHRRAPITGVSEYAFIGEAPVTRPAAPSGSGTALLPALRYAEGFEALRDRADAAPERPKAFIAALGPVAAHSRRVGFATNLFAAGGIETVVATGEADALVSAFRDSGSTLVCLCSSDKVYAESAESEAAALRAAGARYVWLAGQPGERAHRYRSAGVDGYLFAGCDALSALRTALDVLAVKA
ncbi:MAG: methylmalonyl-CoA mutase family protein [Jatrophihabitantaceae bacterium]